MVMTSVIVRFHNEERHLRAVLEAVRGQRQSDSLEIVGVDNRSSDGSVRIAHELCDKVLEIDEYRPGAALNMAVESASGDALVALSAHSIPRDESWLTRLLRTVEDDNVLGVYGGQVYPRESRFLDKRDLDIFSGWAVRDEYTDSDFWNANSAFRRAEWEKSCFDDTVIEMEDHFWTKENLRDEMYVRFEAGAHVYHYGHSTRNDRTIVDRSRGTDFLTEMHKLDSSASWPDLMSAVMYVSSVPPAERLKSSDEIAEALARLFHSAEDFDLRWRVAGALGRIGGDAAVSTLTAGLFDPSFYVRDECAWMLRKVPQAYATLVRMSEDPTLDPLGMPYVGLGLGLMDDREARSRGFRLLCRLILDSDPSTRREAAYFLGELDEETIGRTPANVVEAIIGAVDDSWEDARAHVWCWGRLRGSIAARSSAARFDSRVEELATSHPEPVVRAEAITALGRAEYTELPLRVARRALLRDESGRAQYAAIETVRAAVKNGSLPPPAFLHDLSPDDFGVAFEVESLLSTTKGR